VESVDEALGDRAVSEVTVDAITDTVLAARHRFLDERRGGEREQLRVP
jgi:hypothetical protein